MAENQKALRRTGILLLYPARPGGGEVRASIERGLKSGGVQALEAQLVDAKKFRLRIYACPNAMAGLNIAQNELLDEVDQVMELASFTELARTAGINWYI